MNETKISKFALECEFELARVARKEFEKYAALGGCPREAGLTAIPALQVDIMRWQRNNFGLSSSLTDAVGIVEEFGELTEADALDRVAGRLIDNAKWLDAIGDIFGFTMNLCTKQRLDFNSLLLEGEYMAACSAIPMSTKSTLIDLGQLAHVALKADQKIRGYDDPETARRDICIVLQRIIIAIVRCVRFYGYHAREVLTAVAADIMRRDWTKNRLTGAA